MKTCSFTAYRPSRGFTLAELLVVIVVLGVLSSIAIAIVSGVLNEARKNQSSFNANAFTRTLNTALVAGVAPADIALTSPAPATVPVLKALQSGVTTDGFGIAVDPDAIGRILGEIQRGEVSYLIAYDETKNLVEVTSSIVPF